MLCIAFGTRPEWIKIKPVLKELKKRNEKFVLVFTGQHKDLVSVEEVMSYGATRFVITEMESGGENRLDEIVGQTLLDPPGLEVWTLGDPNYEVTKLMVQGDTSSAFAMALAAFHRKIPVIHLEAGLRTRDLDNPYPEEANRQMISSIASLHLCPTQLAADNIVRERRDEQGDIVVVGNTVLDILVGLEVTTEKKVLVTLHRRENHGTMNEWLANINALAKMYSSHEFVMPMHPNPMVQKYKDILTHVKVVEPMSHDELTAFLASCESVITDSGGIQEEASFFRKPCMVCRKETERTEGIGNFSVLCKGPEFVSDVFGTLHRLPMNGPSPYGDGKAAEYVVDEIQGL
jgi:UDP-N-acetylglucosamine 2-epimerase (non-hydrolysing)